ncbi:Uncharacterised protein [Serratia entomophila]|nr:Uncharacterised protein [Serratia entomophila]
MINSVARTLSAALLALLLCSQSALAQETLIFVRHGENPPITAGN